MTRIIDIHPHVICPALRDRKGLGADRLNFEHLTFEPIYKAFKPMLREQRFDVSEVAIVAAMQAVALGAPVMILPVTIAARFQHKCLVHDIRRGPLQV